MVLAAVLLATAAPTPAEASPAGNYAIRQIEMAGGLELKPDGHFRYAFSYGALDEMAEGDWTFDGKTVFLTSNPRKGRDLLLERHDTAIRFIQVRP